MIIKELTRLRIPALVKSKGFDDQRRTINIKFMFHRSDVVFEKGYDRLSGFESYSYKPFLLKSGIFERLNPENTKSKIRREGRLLEDSNLPCAYISSIITKCISRVLLRKGHMVGIVKVFDEINQVRKTPTIEEDDIIRVKSYLPGNYRCLLKKQTKLINEKNECLESPWIVKNKNDEYKKKEPRLNDSRGSSDFAVDEEKIELFRKRLPPALRNVRKGFMDDLLEEEEQTKSSKTTSSSSSSKSWGSYMVGNVEFVEKIHMDMIEEISMFTSLEERVEKLEIENKELKKRVTQLESMNKRLTQLESMLYQTE